MPFLLYACGGRPAGYDSEPFDLSKEIQLVPVEGGTYTDVSVAGLVFMLENKEFPLINVHVPYMGELEGTDANVPFNQISRNLDKLPADKDAQIVLYCRSGSMSGIAARELADLGYTDVWNLDGGMNAWQASGYGLISYQ
jgi:rhodanese-related sulfurtransferase